MVKLYIRVIPLNKTNFEGSNYPKIVPKPEYVPQSGDG